MSRLEILKASLIKKEALLDKKFETHFADVRQANGQPLNDKRNGRSTLNRWDRQSDALRNLKQGIEKTKRAIEIEEGKIVDTEAAKKTFPKVILDLIETGDLIQWRKHPNTFFVSGVDKARIVWNSKNKVITHRYTSEVTDKEQWRKFAKTFNLIRAALIAELPK